MKRWVAAVVAAALAGAVALAPLYRPDFWFTLGARPNQIPAAAGGYGLAALLTDLSPDGLNQQLSDMKATGVTWVRYDLSWADVQPDSAKSYNWSNYDRVTKAAAA